MSKILITGANSFLVKSISPSLKKDGHYVCSFNHQDLDITDFNSLKKFFEKEESYDLIIHCATKGCGRDTDSLQDFYDNLLMINNLLFFSHKYSKMIVFSSGSEFNVDGNIFNQLENQYDSVPNQYYSFSKYIQTKLIENNPKIINLRIFNCFGPLENENRFVKTCLRNYINKQPLTIFQDKYFDFFYIDDLITIIKYLINITPQEHLELNCVYNEKYKLSEVANIINNLDNYQVPVIIKEKMGKSYCGDGIRLNKLSFGSELIGLKKGIKKYYEDYRMHKEFINW